MKNIFIVSVLFPLCLLSAQAQNNNEEWKKSILSDPRPVFPEENQRTTEEQNTINTTNQSVNTKEIPVTTVNNSSDILIWPAGPGPTPQDALSENSVFIHPTNPDIILTAHNNFYFVDANNNGTCNLGEMIKRVAAYVSADGGQTWTGINNNLLNSRADPAAVIDQQGRMYVNYIDRPTGGQAIAYSDDNGATWNYVPFSSGTCNDFNPCDYDMGCGILDKNHLWVDNSLKSPYQNYLYSAWTNFLTTDLWQIEIVSSTDRGMNWSPPVTISQDVNAICFNQGANIQTGQQGEVYVAWTVYDKTGIKCDPGSYEAAIGFTRNLNGGNPLSWEVSPGITSRRIIDGIKGIRNNQLGNNINMRHNGWPSMTVNQQTGEIYIVWANVGEPPPNGNNTGNADIYMIKSSDKGDTWSVPIKVDQDLTGVGEQWFPWIACDEVTGALVVTFYDSRNSINNDRVQTFIAISYDGGQTWNDFPVSDVDWSGDPPPQTSYAGDYIGVDASNGKIVSVWTDDRNSGILLPYTDLFYIPCLTDLTLPATIITSQQQYFFNDHITLPQGTNFNITPTGNVEMQANTEVLLEGEFVSEGEFYAHTVPCDNSGLRIGNPEVRTSNDKSNYSVGKSTLQANNLMQYSLFPNPARDKITVNSKGIINSIEIKNVLGQSIYQSSNLQINQSTIDLSSHPKGIYFIKVQSGDKVYTEKVVIQ
ncbi:MAG: T9SS type A sorting domain-containing protein [Bacteroidetes bacterium]|nr:T9SS type A sorting domain-containing protein [Bacteroidota bacterium]